MSSLQQSLSSISDNVEIGGPCPLTAAFILSQGGLGNGTNLECELGGFYVRPRIILISVGRPTEFSIIDVDLCPQMETDEVSTLSVDFNTILIINVHFKINTISNFIVL